MNYMSKKNHIFCSYLNSTRTALRQTYLHVIRRI